MQDHHEIYQNQAEKYERLIACEDAEGRLLPALRSLTSWDGKAVVEWGAGTGRLTCLLAPLVSSIHAFDAEGAMLEVAAAKLRRMEAAGWQTAVADHRKIPLPDATGDIAIAGWSLCYLVRWNPEGWRDDVTQALAEMKRILKPGGIAILIETLGTGYESPHPPDHLVDYYAFLEEQGFQRHWIRTDYRFPTREEAERLTRFFFGDRVFAALQDEKEGRGGVHLPECTGLWACRLKGG